MTLPRPLSRGVPPDPGLPRLSGSGLADARTSERI